MVPWWCTVGQPAPPTGLLRHLLLRLLPGHSQRRHRKRTSRHRLHRCGHAVAAGVLQLRNHPVLLGWHQQLTAIIFGQQQYQQFTGFNLGQQFSIVVRPVLLAGVVIDVVIVACVVVAFLVPGVLISEQQCELIAREQLTGQQSVVERDELLGLLVTGLVFYQQLSGLLFRLLIAVVLPCVVLSQQPREQLCGPVLFVSVSVLVPLFFCWLLDPGVVLSEQ